MLSAESTVRPDTDRLVRLGCIAGLAGLFGYFLVYIYVRLSHGHFRDFPTFYHAARPLLTGGDPYVPEGDGRADAAAVHALAVLARRTPAAGRRGAGGGAEHQVPVDRVPAVPAAAPPLAGGGGDGCRRGRLRAAAGTGRRVA